MIYGNRFILESSNNIRKIYSKDKDFEKYIFSEKSISKKMYESLKDNYKGEIILDKDTNTMIGHVFVGDKIDKGFILNLWVNNKYRRQGYGTVLIKDAISKLGGIDLIVNKDNTNAIEMYKKNGFVFLEYDNKTYYWMKLKSKLKKTDKIYNPK